MAVSPIVIKAAAYAATDKRIWILVASIIAGIVLTIVAIIGVFINIFTLGGAIQPEDSPSYKEFITDMQACYAKLDTEADELNEKMQDGTLDKDKLHAIFYTLYFGDTKEMTPAFYKQFVECFVNRTKDESGKETITASSLDNAYQRLGTLVGFEITNSYRKQIDELYSVLKYGAGEAGKDENGNIIAPEYGFPPEALADSTFAQLMTEATKYIGYPYVWGGSTPSSSFDCSGFVCWSYTKSGVYDLPRTTAQGIYNQCRRVSREEARPGDLIFFTRTYATSDPVTHIGIYCGGSTMLHCGDPIGYANIDSNYWSSHFYAIGRLIQ